VTCKGEPINIDGQDLTESIDGSVDEQITGESG